MLGEPGTMASDSDQIKTFERDIITFMGYTGKVSFAEFDKYMSRYMRMKFGRKIGEGLWMDSLPIIEGAGRITNPNFEKHCDDVFLKNCIKFKSTPPKPLSIPEPLSILELLTLYPTAYPSAYPTAYPTAYPSAYPTASSTASSTASLTSYSTPLPPSIESNSELLRTMVKVNYAPIVITQTYGMLNGYSSNV